MRGKEKSKNKRGGARKGAGRKPLSESERIAQVSLSARVPVAIKARWDAEARRRTVAEGHRVSVAKLLIERTP
jgi:hypothetical protein